MLGLGLWYVGFVLFINALWMMGKLDAKAAVPMNIFVAGVQIAGVAKVIATAATPVEFYGAAATLLFTFTYLYVAATNIWNLDAKGLGWYCLPVSIIAVPAGVFALLDGAIGLAILWWMWAVLWHMFFQMLGLGKPIEVATRRFTMVNAVATFLGAYFTLIGIGPPWW